MAQTLVELGPGSSHAAKATMAPPPLTTELLNQALVELGPGPSHAAKACYDCYTKKSMSGADLIAFLKSIQWQSATLRQVFAPPAAVKPVNEVASAEDFAFLMAAFGNAPPKSEEKPRLVLSWSDRRVPEVQRRQRETVENADIRARSGTCAILMHKFRELSATLPIEGKALLLEVMRGANSGRLSDAAVAEGVQTLVDEYNVKVPLTHKFECNVRAQPPPSWRTAKAMVSSEGPNSHRHGADAVAAPCAVVSSKRKRAGPSGPRKKIFPGKISLKRHSPIFLAE